MKNLLFLAFVVFATASGYAIHKGCPIIGGGLGVIAIVAMACFALCCYYGPLEVPDDE
jgi:hypothetical protein